MSKPDNRLKKLVMRHGWITEQDDWKQAVQDIKDVFLELIGLNSSLESNDVLKFKKELRKKVEEL